MQLNRVALDIKTLENNLDDRVHDCPASTWRIQLPIALQNTVRYELFQAIKRTVNKIGFFRRAHECEGGEAVLEMRVEEAFRLAADVGFTCDMSKS